MGTPMGIAAGLLAGLIGAAAWAAIAFYANLEIGYLAWGIGGLVGFAVASGAGKTGPVLGGIAVLITIASICGGKFAVVETEIQSSLTEVYADFEQQLAEGFTDEVLVSFLADGIVTQEESAGKSIDWPKGVDLSEASTPADYPQAIWQNAQKKWDAMDDEGHTEFHAQIESNTRENFEAYIAGVTEEARSEGFFATFSLFDLLFFGLGVVTAWGIAGSAEEDGVPTAEPIQ